MTRRMIWSSLAAVLSAIALAGCSSEKKRQVVSGTVTHRGQPLPRCFIHFHGSDGYLTTTSIQPDGTFTMTDVFPGEYKITFTLEVEKGSGRQKESKPVVKAVTRPIPSKYLSVTTTDLAYTITPDTDRLAIEIK